MQNDTVCVYTACVYKTTLRYLIMEEIFTSLSKSTNIAVKKYSFP